MFLINWTLILEAFTTLNPLIRRARQQLARGYWSAAAANETGDGPFSSYNKGAFSWLTARELCNTPHLGASEKYLKFSSQSEDS